MSLIKLYSGHSHPEFAELVRGHLDVPDSVVMSEVTPADEFRICIHDNVAEHAVVLLQTCTPPVHDHLQELYLMAERLRHATDKKLIVVMPHIFYSHSDTDSPELMCSGLRTLGKILAAFGVDRVVTMNMHAAKAVPFFPVPLTNLPASPILCHYLKKQGLTDTVLVAGNMGDAPTIARYENILDIESLVINRKKSGEMSLNGDVAKKCCIVVDDVIQTGATMSDTAMFLQKQGASRICVVVTHGVFTSGAFDLLSGAPIDEIVVTNTVPGIQEKLKRHTNTAFHQGDTAFDKKKLTVLDVSRYFAEAIVRIVRNEPVDCLSEDQGKLQLILPNNLR